MSQEAQAPASAVMDTRAAIRARYGVDEAEVVQELAAGLGLAPERREAITAEAATLIRRVRGDTNPTMMEAFLDEYGLSTEEGVGLMCLAEALLRVPDAETIDDLIEDKIAPSDWSAHLGQSFSPLVNASTWALMLTGRILDDDPSKPASGARRLMKRLGEPVVRTAVARAMRIMGQQFVLGQTIEEGIKRGAALRKQGYTYSYDMLGEGARTEADAQAFFDSYAHAIAEIAKVADSDIRDNPGISVKLSALSPRYLTTQRKAVEGQVIPRCLELARMAAKAGVGFNIDAEEQDRLDVSLDVIDAVLSDEGLAGWDGFGVVVQAYGKRAPEVLRHLYALAERLDRRIMVRLVKGAYWDTEIKLAQELGAAAFPVFTRKVNTDLCYMACARMLLDMRDRIYAQFATHNAHTCAAVLEMAGGARDTFELQRLHGMGESLHEIVRSRAGTRCRIYAPCGPHKDLLAYLVRRLLENGANSSFVNQIVNEDIPPEVIAADPVERALANAPIQNPDIRLPRDLFQPGRRNSKGYRLEEPASAAPLIEARNRFAETLWTARPVLADDAAPEGPAREVRSPADGRPVGQVHEATHAEVARALDAAQDGVARWSATPVAERAAVLRRISDLYEAHAAELCAIAAREAGKILLDGVAEVREAVDFLRFYADEAERLEAEAPGEARGVFVCISPWNFPLAIYTGQIAAALAAGNAVLAKPAEQTPIIAARAAELFREAGVPKAAFQLLPGDGPTVGGPLTSDPRIAGVCFTGSTETAQRIHRALAANAPADAVLIAETGGLNAMIVDSTALPEQAVDDIVASSFQSAGQRCSALRMLYVQAEAKDRMIEMLKGAMDALVTGDPWSLDTDVAPVIDAEAQADICAYVDARAEQGRLLKRLGAPGEGTFVGAALVEVDGIEDLEREVFGPVLHVASFKAQDIDKTIDAINARGFGLTFALHTRIDDRVQQVVDRLHVGNIYVNRNQIGAIVGSQPFGGEGLSGTGPKAGGPNYVDRFRRTEPPTEHPVQQGADDAPQGGEVVPAERVGAALAAIDATAWAARHDRVQVLRRALGGAGALVRRAVNAAAAFDNGQFELPGPTGESNRLSMPPKGPILCLGPELDTALAQAAQALAAGCPALIVASGAEAASAPLARAGAPVAAIDGRLAPEALAEVPGLVAVAAAGGSDWTRALRRALAGRDGRIVLLETEVICPARFYAERHICIDTTAAGGNASLLAAAA
ncbi:bifunctional proline dehydrogenase/L-glutamate gamma-semialdehyde dehydrogenase [Thiohalocapsa halophila]|uniref:Bifunctional protein PutA n=1 Tax=Thiohalocapsa halophila TaxID=69359 RepID=A0ABS1CEH0_9GAMM|nr:bifunctional proline dehydrogenase/L-glutamate gamma-semialdehyde dehydrogenase PutA [Thiohalocapsa halophila]MBK1630303.1 bifunctional proline dehydrogenase/L-glutamate gamma-semialdehyde dehydrogenase [Thiohalocapsa halophila]